MASISENPTCVPADLNRNLSSAFPVAHEIREQIYKNTFYLTPDAININRLDDGLYVSINPGFTNATGYEASDIIGRTSLELNIWVNQEDRMRLVDGLRQHGSVSNLESQFRTKSGDIRIGQMSAAIVQIENVAHIISVTRDITNRKNLEQQQRDSEERFRRLAEDMPAFVVAGLPDGTLTYANDAIANLVGLNKEELIGMNFFEFLTPTDREMVKSKLAALTPEHPVETHEQIYLDHQQSLAYHQWTNRAFFDITGRMSGFQSVGVDITEMEKQAEALRATKMEFQEARDHYEELYEFAPIGYVTVTATGQIEAINLTGAVLLGYERSKIVNRRFSKFIAPAHQIRWNRQFEHVMKQAEVDPLEIDLELTRADGSNFYGHLHCVRRVDARRGQWLRIAISDISRSRIADLQSRIAAVAFESQEGILILDSNQRILRVNQAFIQITGYTAEEAIGQLPPTFLSSPRQPEDFFMRVNDTLLKQGAWQGEMWHRHKNGSEYQISLMITAVKDDAGTITNFVAAFTDITFRQRAEEKIANLAFRDQLTQLPNRRLLLDRLKQALELSARTRLFGALLFIDLDNFKTCVFQTKLDAESTANWTASPEQTEHPVHGKLDGQSKANWTPLS